MEIRELEKVFGLEKVDILGSMTEMSKFRTQIDAVQEEDLLELSNRASQKLRFWNKQESLVKFIAPLLGLVEFKGDQYRVYCDRQFEAKINGCKIKGTLDILVASGYQKPVEPLFFLHKFNSKTKATDDNVGQVLSAMFVAQSMNNDNSTPFYGCSIFGNEFVFLTLEGKKYAFSRFYDITQTEDLVDVFHFLKGVKSKIEAHFANQPKPQQPIDE